MLNDGCSERFAVRNFCWTWYIRFILISWWEDKKICTRGFSSSQLFGDRCFFNIPQLSAGTNSTQRLLRSIYGSHQLCMMRHQFVNVKASSRFTVTKASIFEEPVEVPRLLKCGHFNLGLPVEPGSGCDFQLIPFTIHTNEVRLFLCTIKIIKFMTSHEIFYGSSISAHNFQSMFLKEAWKWTSLKVQRNDRTMCMQAIKSLSLWATPYFPLVAAYLILFKNCPSWKSLEWVTLQCQLAPREFSFFFSHVSTRISHLSIDNLSKLVKFSWSTWYYFSLP